MMDEHVRGPVLVSDFDGTMTKFDFFRLAQEQLTPPGMHDYWEDYQAGRITHFEAMRCIFSHIRVDEAILCDAIHRIELEPKLQEAVTHLQQAGWEIIVASAGCDWYIIRLLEEAQVHVQLYASPCAFDPAQGLLMRPPVDSPFYSPEDGIDKAAIVQEALDAGRCVAFAGNGQPDLAPALLVPPMRRFARGWLADHFTAQGIPFRAFIHWAEIAEMLVREGGAC